MELRKPCQYTSCLGTTGYITTKNGQDCVYCSKCGRFQYNAPKTETGRAVRPVTARGTIKPGQRARILERAAGRCETCGKPIADTHDGLHIGHIVPVNSAEVLQPEQVNSDENLLAMCEECNLGWSDRPLSPKLFAAVLIARIKRGVE